MTDLPMSPEERQDLQLLLDALNAIRAIPKNQSEGERVEAALKWEPAVRDFCKKRQRVGAGRVKTLDLVIVAALLHPESVPATTSQVPSVATSSTQEIIYLQPKTRELMGFALGISGGKYDAARAVLTKGNVHLRDLYLQGHITAALGERAIRSKLSGKIIKRSHSTMRNCRWHCGRPSAPPRRRRRSPTGPLTQFRLSTEGHRAAIASPAASATLASISLDSTRIAAIRIHEPSKLVSGIIMALVITERTPA